MTNIGDILTGSPFVQGGLTLMIAGWAGYQLRALPGRLTGACRGVITREIQVRESSPLYDAWLGMLTDGALRPGGPRTLEVRTTTDDYDEQAATAGFAAGASSFWSRVLGKYCQVSVGREEAASGGSDLVRRFIIRIEVFFATTDDLAALMRAAKDRANVIEHRQLVDICNKYGARSTLVLPRRESETLCLPRGMFESIANRLSEFTTSREDYERVGIPWRFGVLFYGSPGTGKTSLAHALASHLRRHLAVISLSDLRSDEELMSSFEGVRDESIVLIEDVDCAFRKRENKETEGITFSGFLNCIDGVVAPNNGRILVMSTNHVDRLDPALIRPGRIDVRIETPLLSRTTATDYVDRLFAHVPTRHQVVAEVMTHASPTPAMLINRMMRENWRRTNTTPESPAEGDTFNVGRSIRKRHYGAFGGRR